MKSNKGFKVLLNKILKYQKYQNNTYIWIMEKNNKQCCQLEAVVSFDDRGQLVIPKELRKKFNLSSSEKFAIISCTDGEELCCLSLIKTDMLNGTMSKILAPAMGFK